MIRSTRTRARLTALAAAGLAVGVLTPLAAGGAAAQEAPAPAGPPPAAPVLLGPNDHGPVVKDVVLDWKSVASAESYVVELGTDETWSDDPVLSETGVLGTELALPGWLPNASYAWRVAAVTGGVQGEWSQSGTFTRGWREQVRLLAPAQGASVVGRPTFSWTPVAGASAYQLQVSTNSTFNGSSPFEADPSRDQAGPVVDTCFTTRTEITPFTEALQSKNQDNAGPCVFSTLGTGEAVYWRVRPLDRYSDGSKDVPTTPASSAGISYLPPDTEGSELASDCPGSTAPEPSASPSASAAPAPSGSAAPTAAPSASPSAAPAAPAAGGCEPTHPVYAGRWTAARTLVADYPAVTGGDARTLPLVTMKPLPSPLCRPAPGAASNEAPHSVCDDFPTISWNAVAGAARYRLYVSLTDDFSNIQRIVETSATTWTPTDAWRESSISDAYYYLVQPCTTDSCGRVPTADADGDSVPDQVEEQSFLKRSPAAKTVAAAKPQSIVEGVELRWEDYAKTRREATGKSETAGAYAYRLEVRSGGATFAQGTLVEDVVVDGARCRPTGGTDAGYRRDASLACTDSAREVAPGTDDVLSYVSKAKAYPDANVHWRVQALDPSGNRLPWSAPQTIDATPPTFVVSPMEDAAVDGFLTVTWSEPVDGVTDGTLRLRSTPSTVTPLGDGKTWKLKANATMYAGAPYTVEASPKILDKAGNGFLPKAVTLKTQALVDDKSGGLRRLGDWSQLAASGAVGGTYLRSTPSASAWRIAQVSTFGSAVEVKGCTSPEGGIAEIWSDGRRLAQVDTYRTSTSCGVVLYSGPTGPGLLHVVEVRGTGAKSPASKGTALMVDAVTAK